jgi:hypothetical protein
MSAKRATTSLENPEQPATKVVRKDSSSTMSDEDFEIFKENYLTSSVFKPSAVPYDRKKEQKDVEDIFRSKKRQMTVPNYLHWVKTVQKVVLSCGV